MGAAKSQPLRSPDYGVATSGFHAPPWEIATLSNAIVSARRRV
jgi:hypothetical protein